MFKNFKNRDKASSMQVSYSIRTIAGVYLVYLAYQLVSDGAIAENQGWKKLLMIAAIVVFAVFGAYFAWQGFKGIQKLQNTVPEDAESDSEETEIELETEPDDSPEEAEEYLPAAEDSISEQEE